MWGNARAVLAAAVAGALVLSVPAAPAAQPADPTKPGRHRVTVVEYDAGPAVLAVAPTNGAPIPVDLHGELHVPSGTGPFPVVVLMHGRHGTCQYATFEFLGHPCPRTPATTPVDSFRGYGYLARNLASHGYLVMSVDANGINTYDTADLDSGALARAELISRSLDLLGRWNTGSGPGAVGTRLQNRVDLRRLGLMGHSRGGEGVTRWLSYNRDRTDGPRYTASAVFSLAPTDFGDHVIVDRTAYAVLLPRCDGDVFDLQGSDVFERSQYRTQGPLHQITLEAANHNWFNTVWTYDDSGRSADSACNPRGEDSVRLTPPQQMRAGLAWMASFFRRHVGGERAFDAMLTGRGPATAQCAPDLVVACRDLADLSYSPPPAARTTLLAPVVEAPDDYAPAPGVTLAVGGTVEARGCDPHARMACPRQGAAGTRSRAGGPQLTLTWSTPSSVTLTAAARWRGGRGGDVVVRVGVNATDEEHVLGSGGPRLRLQLTDVAGRTAVVRAQAPEPPPGSLSRSLLLSDVRVPLRAFRGVDVAALRSIRILLDDADGSLQLADVALHR